ncbi:glycosyltransferase [Candidatus Woesearchaeota archaeon]|nr:glycosyltransferase [Candidatus Woesearchaeota archaeon]
MTPQEISLLIYNLALIPVVFVSVLFLIVAILSLYMDDRRKDEKLKKLKHYPFVTVQIPCFNDPVAVNCIKACMNFDYPKNHYEIMLLDDSTNPETQKLLKKFADKNPGFIKYVHRTNRQGYKAGALQEAMHLVKGEIITIFDADFLPDKYFLRKIVVPFENPKVAIVQARQGFSNHETNLISRFAAYLLMIHHAIFMPVNDKLNTVFFCGTAGAIRKKAIDDAGGWTPGSVTEDTDLSIRILSKGYKNVYLKFETPSEVPVTFESFIVQQTRWTFGNLRAFIDHFNNIFFKKGLKLRQRAMITFMTCGNIIAPAVILMTLAGLTGWFLGEPELFQVTQIAEFLIKFLYTIGFIIMALITFFKLKKVREFPQLLLACFSVSIVLAFANTVAIFRAIFLPKKPLFKSSKGSWVCTPKQGNINFEKTR